MKKCRWLIAVLSIVGLVATTNIQTVNAEKYTGQAIWPSEFIDNIYIKKEAKIINFYIVCNLS